MAQVPYSPVPDVGMPDQPTGGIRISGGAIEGASGENIGRAIGHFGRVLEHSGDELFSVAMKLQEQKNEAEALEGDAKLSDRVSDIQFKFTAKEGKQPADELLDYRGEIDKARKEIRDGLSNDAVRRKYDRNALKTQEIANRNGASHAAAQLKQYSKTQDVSSVNLAIRRAYENPNDPIDDLLKDVENTIRRGYRAEGKWSPETIDEQVKKAQEAVIAGRIEGMTREKPAAAQELLNSAIAKGLVVGPTAERLQKAVDLQLVDVTTRNIAHTVLSDPSVSESEAVKKTREMANEYRKGDLKFEDAAVERTMGLYRRREAVKKDEARRDLESVNEAIIVRDVKDIDQLFQDPEVEKAVRRLPTSERMNLQGRINRYQAAKNKPRNDAEFDRLSALRINDPIEFAELDPTTLDVSTSQMNTIHAWQKADRKKPHENAKATQAIQWIKEAKAAELRSLNIFSREKGRNEKEYDKWTGAVVVALDAWHQDHKKYPSQKEILEVIAPALLDRTMGNYLFGVREQAEPSTFSFKGVKEPALIEQKVPKQFEEGIRAEYRKQKGGELTDEQVERAFIRSKLIELQDKMRAKQEGK